MKLNDNDAHAVDMLLNGLPAGSAAAGAADGRAKQGTSTGAAAFAAASASSAVSAMSEDMANRVTHMDQMLRLLDYLPVEEPSPELVQRTMRRIQEAHRQAGTPARAGISPAAMTHPSGAAGIQGLHLSPGAGDEDPASS